MSKMGNHAIEQQGDYTPEKPEEPHTWVISVGDGNDGMSEVVRLDMPDSHVKDVVRGRMSGECGHEEQWVWEEEEDRVVVSIDTGCDPDPVSGNYPTALNGAAFFIVEAVRGARVG